MIKKMGIAVLIIWATLIYTLYPFPPQDVSAYKDFLYEETEIYVETLSKPDRQDYFDDKEAFLESKVEEGKVEIWIIWSLKLLVIASGMLAGYLLSVGNRAYLLVIVTSISYIYTFAVKLANMLPNIDPYKFSFSAYISLLRDGFLIGEHSLLYQLFFYHQFLVLPILHILLLSYCSVQLIRK